MTVRVIVVTVLVLELVPDVPLDEELAPVTPTCGLPGPPFLTSSDAKLVGWELGPPLCRPLMAPPPAPPEEPSAVVRMSAIALVKSA